MKVSLFYTVLILLGLSAFQCHAQLDTVLVKTLGSGEFEEGVDMIYLYDSNLLVLGNSGGGEGSGDFLMAKFDQNNDRIWANTYGSALPEKASTVAELSHGIYAVGGLSYALPPLYQAFVTLIDSNGKQLASQRIGSRDGFSEVRALVKLSSGESYAVFNQWNPGDPSDRRVMVAQLSWNSQFDLTVSTPQVISGTEGFELMALKPSLDSNFLGAGSMHNATLDAHFVKWNESFQELFSATFESGGNEQYNGVADHPQMIVLCGYTDGYNEADKDIIIHKYKQTGVLFGEEVRGHFDGGPMADDEAFDVAFASPTSFFMTGYTTTYGQNPGVTPDVFMSLVDTALYDIPGSTTLGAGNSDVAFKVLPWRNGLLAVGYTDSYGNGLTDVLVIQRDDFSNPILIVQQPDSLNLDSVYSILGIKPPSDASEISAFANDVNIHIRSEQDPIQTASVVDLQGRTLLHLSAANTLSLTLPRNEISQQIVLLVIETDRGRESRLIFLP